MMSSFPSIAPTSNVRRDRSESERATLSLDCSKLAEQCRREHEEEKDEDTSSPVPTPVVNEPTTQPYPSEIYVRMMMQATQSGPPPRPAAQPLPPRPLSLPGVRGSRSSKLEAVLVLLGAVGLPAATIGSLQAIGNPAQSSVIVGKEHNTVPDVVSHKDRSLIPRIREEPEALTEKGPVRGLPNETPPSVAKPATDVGTMSTRSAQPKSRPRITPAKPHLPTIEIED